jgi:hypothetical protein
MWNRAPMVGVLVAIATACSIAQASCSARTPRQALPPGAAFEAQEPTPKSTADFYRLARIVVDSELHRRWALVANCSHPERPLEIVALSPEHAIVLTQAEHPSASREAGAISSKAHIQASRNHSISPPSRIASPTVPATVETSDPSNNVPVIHAGDLVRLWSSDSNVRLEMAVVSLEYGRLGQIIHVHRVGQASLLAAVVVGKGSAELIP